MESGFNLGSILDVARLARVRTRGGIVLDVDDTVLARERAEGGEESFAHSASASLLPKLLQRGFRMCFITGHGWGQLELRLIRPLLEQLQGRDRGEAITRLHIYANRGATKISWNGERYVVCANYSDSQKLDVRDLEHLRSMLESLGRAMMEDFGDRPEWYRETYPGFDFDLLPPEVTLREDAVLVLRPIPSKIHLTNNDGVDIRAAIYEKMQSEINGLVLNSKYEVAAAGRSSIEITRRGVSKRTAVRDLISEVSAISGDNSGQVEESLIYVGDEFFPGGNDYVVASDFPNVLCVSVAERVETPAGGSKVVDLPNNLGLAGTSATEAVLKHVLDLSI